MLLLVWKWNGSCEKKCKWAKGAEDFPTSRQQGKGDLSLTRAKNRILTTEMNFEEDPELQIRTQAVNTLTSVLWYPMHSSVGKESACNAGDPGSIPGSRSSTGEGIGYPLQYSWTSLVDQLIKNPPAMRETWVWSLGWEDPLEKGKATHSSILAWRISWTV